jgi:hypothetical protein
MVDLLRLWFTLGYFSVGVWVREYWWGDLEKIVYSFLFFISQIIKPL